MRRIENHPIPNRTKIFTEAKFAAVKALSDAAEPIFPPSNILKPQNPSLDVQRMILFFKAPNKYNPVEHSQHDIDEKILVDKIAKYPWASSMPSNSSLSSEKKKHLTRFNISQAINLVRDGFALYDP